MKFLPIFAVLVLCIGVIYGLPTPTEEVKEENSPEQQAHELGLLQTVPKVDGRTAENYAQAELGLGNPEPEVDALTSVDSNPPGDSGKRAKRFIWFGWPVVYSYPSAYVIG